MEIKSRRGASRVAYDDPHTEFWIELPSGRNIFFDSLVDDNDWETEAEAMVRAEKHKAELYDMIRELGEIIK